jgi:hypothetical protein
MAAIDPEKTCVALTTMPMKMPHLMSGMLMASERHNCSGIAVHNSRYCSITDSSLGSVDR